MREIIIDGVGTYSDWGMVLKAGWSRKPPKTKTRIVEIPGSSNVVDFTEYFGEPLYSTSELAFSLYLPPEDPDGWESLRQAVATYLHGQRRRIMLPDDPEHYLTGRLSVGGLKVSRAVATIDIEAECDPWLYKMAETVVIIAAGMDGKGAVLGNSRRRVSPMITVAGNPASVRLRETTYSLAAGAPRRVTGFVLYAGDNAVTVTGVGGDTAVTFAYQEGAL
jgi:hypothetical protein